LAVKFRPQQLFLCEITPIPIEYEVGWAPEPVSTFWRKKNFFPPVGFDPRTVQPIARSPYIAHVFSFSNFPSVASATQHNYHFTNYNTEVGITDRKQIEKLGDAKGFYKQGEFQ